MSKVTIVIPTRNRFKYLKKAIWSVLHQTYRNLELIIVDNNDPANNESIKKLVRYYFYMDKRINYVKERQIGISKAMNTGLKLARSKYVMVMGDDDMMYPICVQALVDALDDNKDCIATCGNAVWINKDDKILMYMDTYKNFYNNITKLENTGVNDCINASAIMLRKSFITKYEGFNRKYRWGVDNEAWRRLLKAGERIVPINEYIIQYRVHSGQITQTKFVDKLKRW